VGESGEERTAINPLQRVGRPIEMRLEPKFGQAIRVPEVEDELTQEWNSEVRVSASPRKLASIFGTVPEGPTREERIEGRLNERRAEEVVALLFGKSQAQGCPVNRVLRAG
jgi:hypothetical protein